MEKIDKKDKKLPKTSVIMHKAVSVKHLINNWTTQNYFSNYFYKAVVCICQQNLFAEVAFTCIPVGANIQLQWLLWYHE